MPEQWRVLKFGGTSVDDARRWHTIAELASAHVAEDRRVVLVCSALAGTTNALQAMSVPGNGAPQLLDALLLQHQRLARGLHVPAEDILSEARSRIQQATEAYRADPQPSRLAVLMANGEWLSTRIGHRFLEKSMKVDWVEASEALVTEPETKVEAPRAWLSARCAAHADDALASDWSRLAAVVITQGFLARRADGGIALLGRGGSDTSAALLAGRLSAPAVEIWTDVPGLFTADPMHERGARLLMSLDYAEALEMAASGARVVHPRCIRAAADCDLPLLIRDINRPQLPGTRIGRREPGSAPGAEGVKAVTRQDGVLVLLLENRDTRQQVGFLTSVFSVISELGISVDLVATSETTTTLAINGLDNHLDPPAVGALNERLSALCRVQLFENSSCINLVGQGVRTALAAQGRAMEAFREHPLLMLSLSANDMCLSFLVAHEHAPGLVHALHAQVVAGVDDAHPVFGPEWRSLAG